MDSALSKMHSMFLTFQDGNVIDLTVGSSDLNWKALAIAGNEKYALTFNACEGAAQAYVGNASFSIEGKKAVLLDWRYEQESTADALIDASRDVARLMDEILQGKIFLETYSFLWINLYAISSDDSSSSLFKRKKRFPLKLTATDGLCLVKQGTVVV